MKRNKKDRRRFMGDVWHRLSSRTNNRARIQRHPFAAKIIKSSSRLGQKRTASPRRKRTDFSKFSSRMAYVWYRFNNRTYRRAKRERHPFMRKIDMASGPGWYRDEKRAEKFARRRDVRPA